MIKKSLREFPAVRADFAGAELYYARIINPHKSNKNNWEETYGSHRFIGRSGLRLGIRNLLLTALSTRELVADRLLGFGHHSGPHVLLHELLVSLSPLRGRHLAALHVGEAFGSDLARDDTVTEVIVLALEVEEEDLHAALVGCVGLLVVCESDGFDGLC